MSTIITTSVNSAATAFSNQKRIDRTSNETLWAVIYSDPTPIQPRFFYSLDDGITWSAAVSGFAPTGVGTSLGGCSFFIDEDDYAHLAFKSDGNGYIQYIRGTPNVDQTGWTWSAVVNIDTNTWTGGSNDNGLSRYPDIVAHRQGTGWVAHIVWSVGNSYSAQTYVQYMRVTIDASGIMSAGGGGIQSQVSGTSGQHSWPSVDFHHIGDGKTVKDGTPHIYIGFSAGGPGTGKGIQFRKVIYSAETWTSSAVQGVDSNAYLVADRWMTCHFDGTRFNLCGFFTNAVSGWHLTIYEVDVDAEIVSYPFHISAPGAPDQILSGSSSYDPEGNIYFLGRSAEGANGSRPLIRRLWNRATALLEDVFVLEASALDTPYLSTKRNHSAGKLEWIYTDGVSPFSIRYDGMSLNFAPRSPKDLSEFTFIDVSSPIVLSWTHDDPDADPQKSYQIRYRMVE